MRRLIYVPIVHTQVDMGSMQNAVENDYIKKYGKAKWKEHLKAIDKMWSGITKKLEALDLNYKKVKLYQDGLPVCGKELEIVQDIAQRGGKNHRLILTLLEKGATLEGTEDVNLLLNEYNYIKATVQGGKGSRGKSLENLKEKGKDILTQRDRFIAKRIDKTLNNGWVGICFIGAEHKMDKYLPKDIKVVSWNRFHTI